MFSQSQVESLVSKLGRRGVLAAATLLVSVFGVSGAWSYLRTAHREVGKIMRDAVPITFELRRLEQLTQDLIPELQANRKVAAQLDVEVEYLEREVADLTKTQADAQSQMVRLRESMDSNGEQHEFGGRTFTRREIEEDLDRRLTRFDDARSRLDAKRRILDSRKKTLAAATERIHQHAQQQAVLVEKAEALQAELKLVELAQSSGSFSFDPSKLAQAKDVASSVEKRIRVLQKLAEGEQLATQEPGIPVQADSRPVSQRFDEYFGTR